MRYAAYPMATISLEIRRQQLINLAETLRDLISVLRKDPSCPWTSHFQEALARAESLLASGFTQEDLVAFSSHVNSVYSGSGSFSGYAPSDEGTENFETFAGAVYDRALELRVVGHR
jgi:hypothetical protein